MRLSDPQKTKGVMKLSKGQSILTKREKEIFDLLVHNLTTSEIAEELKISEKTVRNHISNVILKLNVKGRSQAIIELLKIGIIEL
jgi:LuxR family transcriptional regulator of spore coat protein